MKLRLHILVWLAACCLSASAAAAGAIPVFGYVVKQTYPHDPGAFTQGLFYRNGFLYESTGLHGRSSIRKVKLETGEVLQRRDIDEQYFGEGITAVGNEIVAITWTSQVGFTFDLDSFAPRRSFRYAGQGWGLTDDGKRIYMSDGSTTIRVLDPRTLDELGTIRVSADGMPVPRLNELEWVDGELFANVWGADVIARIDPASGKVTGWIDLAGLLAQAGPVAPGADVLNGIAFDPKTHRLFVTGKLWPKLFEIELRPR